MPLPVVQTQLGPMEARPVAIVDGAGNVVVPGGGGGGGGGDASAANQTTGNTSLAAINAGIGAPADTAATSDTGTFSLIALVKRWFSKLPASLGAKAGTGSLSVVPATDASFAVSLAPGANATTTLYARSLVLKATAGVLYGMSGYNSKISEQFIQVHDAAAEPANNAVPKVFVKVAASSSFTLDFGPRGRAFATGIVVCNSSTGPTLTIGAADCWIDGQVA